MVVWPVLVLAVAVLAKAARPDPPNSPVTSGGPLKLENLADCAVVAFSATQGSVTDGRLLLSETLVNKGTGYVGQTGIFTTHCPGLYQFSFAGYGSPILHLTLKRKLNNLESWVPVVSVGPGGGSNVVLLNMETGDQIAVFVDSGKILEGVTFSGYRIAKK